ncbi:MAG: GTP-binding protein [Candidatus Lokiarchaeota archaeon]|nr:GTP-binding protein [Candidatus Lokiarchaeota archaeon]MCK4480696.1 GTP-binding protein [Candidatus Lokiarchaeota archaeon]
MSEDKKEGKLVFHERTEMIFKIIVIGDPAVGKTSLLTNFCGDKFNYEYIPTVGVNITKEPITTKDDMGKDITVNLMIWDIAGQPQFYMLHRPYFNGADGMMLVYDITRSSSFSNINNWWSTSIKYGLSAIPRILIGNKIDLQDDRKIILPMAEHLSEKISAPFFETSALTGENVKSIFQKIAELALRSKLEE